MITLEQLQVKVPSAFAIDKSTDRSGKYQVISTMKIVQALIGKGFILDKGIEAKTRKNTWKGFQKHQLFFDFPGENQEAYKLQLRLVNSFNGGSSLQLHVGVYVCVCSNGLVAAEGEKEQIRLVHIGENAQKFNERVDEALLRITKTNQVIKRMSETLIDHYDQIKFAEYGASLRWGDVKIEFDPRELLTCHHEQQKDGTVWNIYNRIQENLIKGFSYKVQNKFRRTRQVKGIDANIMINKELWAYAVNLI